MERHANFQIIYSSIPFFNTYEIGSSSSASGETPFAMSQSPTLVLYTLTVPGPSGSPSIIVISGTTPAAPTITPESTGVALTWTVIQSGEISIGSSSVPTSAWYGNEKDTSSISARPTMTSPSSNSSTLVVPLWTPDMLGSAYGGGYITTPSIYVTLSGTPGFTEEVPPGYGSTFRPTSSVTVVLKYVFVSCSTFTRVWSADQNPR